MAAFSLAMGSYAGPVMLQMTGGTYMDEATGTTMPMMAGDVMTAVLPSMTAGQTLNGVQVTPLTAMAQTQAQHMSGGMTDANITAANSNVGKYFMVTDVLHNVPMNPLTSGSGNSATQDQINYGMALAAMSQYAQSQGMSSSSAMVTAMMNDAIGRRDGRQDVRQRRDDGRHEHEHVAALDRRHQRHGQCDVRLHGVGAEPLRRRGLDRCSP